jgi:hypothetical protein
MHGIFSQLNQEASPSKRFLVRSGYLQIYNETISDLLRPERSGLSIRHDKRRGVHVHNLSEWVVTCPGEVEELLRRGKEQRATAATVANDASSRSHAVFTVTVERVRRGSWVWEGGWKAEGEGEDVGEGRSRERRRRRWQTMRLHGRMPSSR